MRETSQNIKPIGNAEIPLNCNDFVSNFAFPKYLTGKKGWNLTMGAEATQALYWKVAERVCGCSIVSNFEQVSTLTAPL